MRWLVVVGLLLGAMFAVSPAAHAQYVGGQPPTLGGTDKGSGPPTEVQGITFGQTQPAGPETPKSVKHDSSGLIGPFTLGDILTAMGIIGALGLLWFLFAWRRRREDEEEEGLAAPA